MFLECSCVHVCMMSPKQTLLPQYLGYLLTEFDQTFTTNGLSDKDEHVKIFGSKGHRSRLCWGQICPKMHSLALMEA